MPEHHPHPGQPLVAAPSSGPAHGTEHNLHVAPIVFAPQLKLGDPGDPEVAPGDASDHCGCDAKRDRQGESWSLDGLRRWRMLAERHPAKLNGFVLLACSFGDLVGHALACAEHGFQRLRTRPARAIPVAFRSASESRFRRPVARLITTPTRVMCPSGVSAAE